MPEELSLRDFIDVRFSAFEKRLDEICNRIVGKDRFDGLEKRVEKLEAGHEDMRRRVGLNERAVWLGQIIGGIAVAVLTALLVALVSGKISLVWH